MRKPFVYSPSHDLRDGEPWDEEDIRDLAAVLNRGGTIRDAASLLCRGGAIDDVARKAKELGLESRRDRQTYSNLFGERYGR
ncbi:hypothetical protein IQ17_01050 [Bradyrhizobium daqingense]|uniref:Uncharacterized protein n=1 Tax=Bradyrhizobium daqingense TaxID=993502 RepID=A0A562LQS0_9BRAD|nr:hypothetical protein IQ17_01050 [Bradyrhizobium daqingense]